MAYRFENARHAKRDRLEAAQDEARFWRKVSIAVVLLLLVGIMAACAPQPEGYMSAVVEYEE